MSEHATDDDYRAMHQQHTRERYGTPTSEKKNELLRLRTENEQLRALVFDCENRIYCDSWRMEYNGKEESDKADAELRDIQQRAKALGIEVNG